MVNSGNWVKLDKNIKYIFPHSESFSQIEAMLSVVIDIDENTVKGIREYARIFNWSKSKTDRFLKSLGYPDWDKNGSIRGTVIRMKLNKLDKSSRPATGTESSHNYKTKTYYMELIPEKLRRRTGFDKCWKDWIDYRYEEKKPLSERAAKMQLKKMSQFSNPELCIERSIENQWQGLFDYNENTPSNRNNHNAPGRGVVV